MIDFTALCIKSEGEIAKKAANLFANEIFTRVKKKPCINESSGDFPVVIFKIKDEGKSESFYINVSEGSLVITAHRLRGLIYGYSLFLRKSLFENGKITLLKNISGTYSPSKKIRGHQIGYRDCNNTYDAWDEQAYRRYFLDLMMFGMNTYEGIPSEINEKNSLMKMTGNEMLVKTAEICAELDLDVSVWHPTESSETDEQAKEKIISYYSSMPKLDVLFIPGGDPGDMIPCDFFKRCKAIKESLLTIHPKAEVWLSAQAPHEYPDWGENFKTEIQKEPDYIDGIIYGPNHAMPLEELRLCTPAKYPIRFYPDVTHNVRCEFPVHFQTDDWHFALAATLGRESINPRPVEYSKIYAKTQNFVEGSVSYSDGINDDVNKIIFASLDFDTSASVAQTLEDYARAFVFQTDAKEFADCILFLEQNWQGAPDENPFIELTLRKLLALAEKQPSLYKNFRFVMCLFRAECDALVKRRMIFENELIQKAKENIEDAKKILCCGFSKDYLDLRQKIDEHAQILFDLIGMQLDVKTYHGKSWERGCTLETIDRPITDRQFLLSLAEKGKLSKASFQRGNAAKHEVYFSFALHGFEPVGQQAGEFYIDFQGDRPANDGSLPMSVLKVFDHFNFRCAFGSFKNKDYELTITYKKRNYDENANQFKITVNNTAIYYGKPLGGKRNFDFEEAFLNKDYISISYDIPKNVIKNGFAEIKIEEPSAGFLISEFWIKEKV